MEKAKSPGNSGGFTPPSGRYSVFSPPGNTYHVKTEQSSSSLTLPPLAPGNTASELGPFGHGTPAESSRFSHDISRMPDNPPKKLGHRRAHSEILTLPDDISFDSDLGVVGGVDGPSFSDETEEDLLSMYLDMDKFNSSSATSSFQVGEPSSAAACSGSASAYVAATPSEKMTGNSNERPRFRHQHSQSMDGSTTIKQELLMSGSEETSAADSKKAMSAAKLAELALIDPKRAKSYDIRDKTIFTVISGDFNISGSFFTPSYHSPQSGTVGLCNLLGKFSGSIFSSASNSCHLLSNEFSGTYWNFNILLAVY